MNSCSAVLAASVAAIMAATAPAFAGDSVTLNGMVVAGLNHDVDAYVQAGRSDAKIVKSVPPEMPAFENALQIGGTVTIKIQLDADGRLTGAAVYASSGRMRIDQSALSAVRSSTYRAASVNGHAIGGSYLVDVVLDPSS